MKIASEFKKLVEKNFVSIREVSQYAAMLHITPKHLAEITKEHTGKSPKELINDMLLLEARVLLGSTDQSITEIAHRLQFGDQSHFCHFIKQHTGLSPQAFRKNL
jgi:AraC-like DNA-binding protein